MEFCERILALRKEHNKTQQTVAEAIKVTTRQYQRFECGEQKPGYDNLIKLADFYDVSLDWLTGRKDRREVT